MLTSTAGEASIEAAKAAPVANARTWEAKRTPSRCATRACASCAEQDGAFSFSATSVTPPRCQMSRSQDIVLVLCVLVLCSLTFLVFWFCFFEFLAPDPARARFTKSPTRAVGRPEVHCVLCRRGQRGWASLRYTSV